MRLTDFSNVYFTCTGNTCRSPLAAAILQQKLAERGITGITVESRMAAIYNYGGSRSLPASQEACDIFRRHYDDDSSLLYSHCARQFTSAEFSEADLIIAMEPMLVEGIVWSVEKHGLSPYHSDGYKRVYTLGDLLRDPALKKIRDPQVTNKYLARFIYESAHEPKDWSKVNDLPASWQDETDALFPYILVFDQLERGIDRLLSLEEISLQWIPDEMTRKKFSVKNVLRQGIEYFAKRKRYVKE